MSHSTASSHLRIVHSHVHGRRGGRARHHRGAARGWHLVSHAGYLEEARIEPGSAQYLHAVGILSALENKEPFLAQLASALKPGGRACIDFHHACSWQLDTAAGVGPDGMTAMEVLDSLPRDVVLASVKVHVCHYDEQGLAIGGAAVVTYEPYDFAEVTADTSPDRMVREAAVRAPGAVDAVRSEVRVELEFAKDR